MPDSDNAAAQGAAQAPMDQGVPAEGWPLEPERYERDAQVYWRAVEHPPAANAAANHWQAVNVGIPGNPVYYDPAVLAQLRQNMFGFGPPEPPIPQETDEAMPATKRIKLLNPFKVGADPEFVLLDAKGELVMSDIPHDGQVGHDHGGRVLELRPTPSRSCLRLVQNMQRLIQESPRLAKWRNPRWRAGGYVATPARYREPLGGHVHLDLPFEQNLHGLGKERLTAHYKSVGLYTPEYITRRLEETERVTAAIAACDKLSGVLEDLDILPAKEAKARRASGHGYGAKGDVRTSNGHLEYRTPVSWLFNPATAYFVLTGYKLAAAEPESIVRANLDWPMLKEWFRQFAAYDDDAARVSENLPTLRSVQGDPDCDFKELWAGKLAI